MHYSQLERAFLLAACFGAGYLIWTAYLPLIAYAVGGR